MKRRKPARTAADEDSSRLEGDRAQEVLFDLPPAERAAKEAKVCTGQWLWEHDRDTYQAIVKALAAGMSFREIAGRWSVGNHTIRAIRRREQTEVATLKRRIASAAYDAAELGAERLAEVIHDCESVVELSMATKAMAEVGNLMSGQATQITEARVITVDATGAAERLRQRAAQMGLEAGEKSALGADRPVGAGAQVATLPAAGERLALGPVVDVTAALDIVSDGGDTPGPVDQGSAAVCHLDGHQTAGNVAPEGGALAGQVPGAAAAGQPVAAEIGAQAAAGAGALDGGGGGSSAGAGPSPR